MEVTEDPLRILVTALREYRAPPLPWVVEFAENGRIDRAWAATSDPDAMEEIIGKAWTGKAMLPLRPEGRPFSLFQLLLRSPAVQAGLVMGMGVLVDTLAPKTRSTSPIIGPVTLPVTTAVAPYVTHLMAKERSERVQRIRVLHPVPPTLKELFERYGVGTHGAEA